MSGLDVKQVKDLVRQSIGFLPGGNDAVNLVLGTCMVESNLTFVKQVGGPALGIAQMEPATFDDCVKNWLSSKPQLKRVIETRTGTQWNSGELVWNLQLAMIMCRIKYLRAPGSIPSDAAGMAQYHKTVYNTSQGKADASKNTPIFQQAINA